jgi:septum site-determining protein MinC
LEKIMDDVISLQSFKLKGRLYTLTVLHIFNADLALFTEQLADAVQRAPRLFEQTPVVLDCSALVEIPFDLDLFCQKMRHFGLYPVGVQNSSPLIQSAAQKLGLPLLNASSQHDKPVKERKAAAAETRQALPEIAKAKLHTTPIRSGQQIVSNGDLIVTSTVSHGAELLAEGHIHVYGALRGRALAGITGDKQARIFCQALEAELVAIAGIYCLSDAMQKAQGPCQIFLQDDCIQIEPL